MEEKFNMLKTETHENFYSLDLHNDGEKVVIENAAENIRASNDVEFHVKTVFKSKLITFWHIFKGTFYRKHIKFAGKTNQKEKKILLFILAEIIVQR